MRHVFYCLLAVCVFGVCILEVHAGARINYLGVSGKTYLASTVKPENLKSGLVGHWTFDGKDMTPNVRDVSGTGNHATLNGFSSGTTTVPGKVGQALSFSSASTQVARAANNATLDLTTTLSVSMWIYRTGGLQTYARIIDHTACCGAGYNIQVSGTSGGTVMVGGGSGVDQLSSNTVIQAGRWYHVVWTYNDPTSNIYINGVLDRTGTGPTGSFSTGHNLGIGCSASCGITSETFDGYIDEVRLYNRAITAEEVRQIYRLGFLGSRMGVTVTPEDMKSGLVGHWTFDGPQTSWSGLTTKDSSGYNNTASFGGMTSAVGNVEPGYIGQGIATNGSSTYVTMPDANQLDTTSVTVAFWFKDILDLDSSCTVWGSLVRKNSGVWGAFGSGWGVVQHRDGTGEFAWDVNNGIEGTRLFTTGGIDYTPVGLWTHLAFTYDESTGVKHIYVNGVSIASADEASGAIPANNEPIYLGRGTVVGCAGSGNGYIQGVMDDVRVYNRSLLATEIQSIMKIR